MPEPAVAEQLPAKVSKSPFGIHLNRAGRPKGSKNYLTRQRSVADLASPYGPEAIAKLVKLMRHSENEQTQAWAASALLDRAYGKPHQSVSTQNESVHYVVAAPQLPKSIDEWKRMAAAQIDHQPTEDNHQHADETSAKQSAQVIDQPTDHKD